MKTLTYSASFYEDDENTGDTPASKAAKKGGESLIMILTVAFSVVLAVGLFILLPAFAAEFLLKWIESSVLIAVIEGVIRLILFLGYVWAISLMEDMKRVFMYHGAEHKTINCLEAGVELTPENVMKFTRFHKRCGTSFIFFVMIVSIIVFMFITAEQMWLRFLLRLLLIPVVAGVSYEFIRMAGRSDSGFWSIVSRPGMWVQKLTTREPDEDMIQVAIVAVETVLYGKAYADAVNDAQGIVLPNTELEVDDLEGF